MRLLPVDRAGKFAAQNQAPVHVLSGHAVTRQVDNLAGINVVPRTQRCRGVEKCYRLADAPGLPTDLTEHGVIFDMSLTKQHCMGWAT